MSNLKLKNSIVSFFAASLAAFFSPANAHATNVEASLFVDDAFSIRIGTTMASTEGLLLGEFVGWNTLRVVGSSLQEGKMNYLKIYAYDAGGIAGMIGKFTLSDYRFHFMDGSQFLVSQANSPAILGSTVGFYEPYIPILQIGLNGAVSAWPYRAALPSNAAHIWTVHASTNDRSYFLIPIEPSDTSDDDRDSIVNFKDNCPSIENPDQADSDRNGVGDVCEVNYLVGQIEAGKAIQADLSSRISDANQRNVLLDQELTLALASNRGLQESLASCQADLSSSRAQVQDLELQKAQLEAELSNSRAQVSALQSDKAQLEALMVALNVSLSESQGKLAVCSSNLSSLQAKIDSMPKGLQMNFEQEKGIIKKK